MKPRRFWFHLIKFFNISKHLSFCRKTVFGYRNSKIYLTVRQFLNVFLSLVRNAMTVSPIVWSSSLLLRFAVGCTKVFDIIVQLHTTLSVWTVQPALYQLVSFPQNITTYLVQQCSVDWAVGMYLFQNECVRKYIIPIHSYIYRFRCDFYYDEHRVF